MQGLGFRPFVYHLAKRYQQNGWVANACQGVSIAVEGEQSQQQQFLFDLQHQLPPLAKIDTIRIQKQERLHANDFQIKSSSTEGSSAAFVLPDISPCQDCISDLFNPQSRFYRYPFTSCCFCGPRYSIMLQQPYDRIRTSMNKFNACSVCLNEYSSPENRRFHSQIIACPNCGPQLSLLDSTGDVLLTETQALSKTVELLGQGKIIAIKGVAGFQLLADATNSDVVERLRLRKHRPEKPFALMVADINSAKALCDINCIEAQALQSYESPIVLLKRLAKSNVVNTVAPNNNVLGLMLPASSLHHLIARDFGKPLIATSGNRANEPICITDQQALERLADIADFFLTHNRPIVRPLDDSIVRNINNKSVVLRRARGYTPIPVTISTTLPDTLALGGQMKSTLAISQGKQLILSQHLGDLNTMNSQQQYKQTIDDLQGFYGVSPRTVIHDLHPDYHSSIIASHYGKKTVATQHHQAHVLSCMAEHDIQTPVLGFAWDGTGLGIDHTIWWGECFLVAEKNIQHFASIRQFPLVGGDKAANEPRRSALGLLYELDPSLILDNKLSFLSAFTQQELSLCLQSLNKKLNTPYTSSIGRLFDAVASLLGVCHINQFEGQAAISLEQLASSIQCDDVYPVNLIEGPCLKIDWQDMISALISDIDQQNKAVIAAKFHNTLAEVMLQIAKRGQQNTIVLSGGCFQNAYLTETCVERLKSAGFTVYTHEKIPPNDGGLALGQLYYKAIIG